MALEPNYSADEPSDAPTYEERHGAFEPRKADRDDGDRDRDEPEYGVPVPTEVLEAEEAARVAAAAPPTVEVPPAVSPVAEHVYPELAVPTAQLEAEEAARVEAAEAAEVERQRQELITGIEEFVPREWIPPVGEEGRYRIEVETPEGTVSISTKTARMLAAIEDPHEKFLALSQVGLIPPGSEYAGATPEGEPTYIPPKAWAGAIGPYWERYRKFEAAAAEQAKLEKLYGVEVSAEVAQAAALEEVQPYIVPRQVRDGIISRQEPYIDVSAAVAAGIPLSTLADVGVTPESYRLAGAYNTLISLTGPEGVTPLTLSAALEAGVTEKQLEELGMPAELIGAAKVEPTHEEYLAYRGLGPHPLPGHMFTLKHMQYLAQQVWPGEQPLEAEVAAYEAKGSLLAKEYIERYPHLQEYAATAFALKYLPGGVIWSLPFPERVVYPQVTYGEIPTGEKLSRIGWTALQTAALSLPIWGPKVPPVAGATYRPVSRFLRVKFPFTQKFIPPSPQTPAEISRMMYGSPKYWRGVARAKPTMTGADIESLMRTRPMPPGEIQRMYELAQLEALWGRTPGMGGLPFTLQRLPYTPVVPRVTTIPRVSPAPYPEVAPAPIRVPTVVPIAPPIPIPGVPGVEPVTYRPVPLPLPGVLAPVVYPYGYPAPYVAPYPIVAPLIRPWSAPAPAPAPVVSPIPYTAPYPIAAPAPAPAPYPAPVPAPAPVPVPIVTPVLAPTPVPVPLKPPIFPIPFLRLSAPRFGRRRRMGIGRLLKGPVGAWGFAGHPVFGPHPLTGAVVGGIKLTGEIPYGAVKPRIPKPKPKKRKRMGITGEARITGSEVGYAGRAFVPATGV